MYDIQGIVIGRLSKKFFKKSLMNQCSLVQSSFINFDIIEFDSFLKKLGNNSSQNEATKKEKI